MKLSFIFELLLIFILVAFAASAVIETSSGRRSHKTVAKRYSKTSNKRQNPPTSGPTRFCSCAVAICNCCRDFNIPIIPIKGPGCASLQYLKGDKLAISMRFGDRVLANTTISSRRPDPICMPLPGGVSKFCGRVYNIGREGTEFNACLGFELRSLNLVEAALRVACFRFGSKGLRVEPPQPLPVLEEDDDDDDDDDDYDYDAPDTDYTSLSVLDDDFIGDYFQESEPDNSNSNKKKVTVSTKAPVKQVTRKPAVKPSKITQKVPLRRRVTTKPTRGSTTPKTLKTSTTTEKIPLIPILPDSLNEIQPKNETMEKITDEASSTVLTVIEESTATEISVQGISTTEKNSVEEIDMTEASTSTIEAVTTTAKPTKNKDEDSDESDEDEDEDEDSDEDVDPFSQVIDEIADVDDESKEQVQKNKVKKNNSTKENDEESQEVFDEIVDGVAGVIDDETDEAPKKEQQDDDNDEDDESKKFKSVTRKFRGSRESRDMWLDRLH